MAPPATRQRPPIEAKVAVGSFTGIIAGLITWGLVAYVPAFRGGLPAPVAALVPVAVAWLAHTVAGYLAPHTPRPVTVVPVTTLSTGGNVSVTPPSPVSAPPAGSL